MKRILYLSYDGMTDPLGQSQVIPYLQGLSKKGYQFTILSFEKPRQYNREKEYIKVILDQSRIRWIPLRYHKFPPVLSTLFDLWLMYAKTRKLHMEKDFDIIHCRSYLSGIVGLRMKKKFNIKFLFDMRGFWADERMEGGIWNLKNPIFMLIYNYFKKKEIQFLEWADYTISLTHSAKQEIHQWPQIKNNPIPIEVIPCCADLQHFDRSNTEEKQLKEAQARLGLNDKDFILVYLGSLGTWYRLDEMLKFFKVLLDTKPNAKFLILSKDTHIQLPSMLSNLGIEKDKVVLTSASYKEIPVYLKLANLAVFFYHPSFSKKATSPVKQGELMGMGIPIICNAGIGDTAEIIQDSGSGVVIDSFNEENYRSVCAHIEDLKNISFNKIISAANQHYSLQDGVSKYREVYEKIS